MTDYDTKDFFRDEAFVDDPYPYFDQLRAKCPVTREPHHDVMMVTGYEEALAVLNDTERFSSCNSVTGPFPGFPVPLTGDNITELIEQYRDRLPMSDQLPTFDPPKHTDHRSLLLRLITPKRLRENEEFMLRLADRQIDEFIADGQCEFVKAFAGPFALLVIADLLGVPEEDQPQLREDMQGDHHRKGAAVGGTKEEMSHGPLELLYARFTKYIEDARRAPRDDVLTGLATATFKDGTLPDVQDVVRIAANLFAAGQETTVRLLAYSLQKIGDDREIQQLLRDEPARIGNFVEEALRMESPIKGDFRLARVNTEIAGVEVRAGTTVMIVNGAANRDPRKFDDPNEFQVDRANARHHIAFGFGAHVCPGAPLARSEGRIAIERLLARMADIRISDEHHGPPDARRYDYAPTYILRGLNRLHLEFTTAS